MPRSLRDLAPNESPILRYRPTRTPLVEEGEGSERVNRIVHIGLGAFARAHIATLTQRANELENSDQHTWRISGIVRSNAALQQSLKKQDHRYVVYEIAEQATAQVIDCVDEVLRWQQDFDEIIARLIAPETKLVTITVTEKGYYLNSDGRLDTEHEDIQSDLHAQGSPTRTLLGLLCDAARARKAAELPGLTVFSCDNVGSNGVTLKSVLGEFAKQIDTSLADWIEQNLHCPNTVVDCIVPKVTPEQIGLVQSTCDIDDKVPVLCEPYRQWVIASERTPAPNWQASSVEWVADIRPYEERKLRILNAAHSALAYLGLLEGCEFVFDAMRNRPVLQQLHALMDSVYSSFSDEESARSYFYQIERRFKNPAMKHALVQIGTDGSKKLPQRFGPSIAALQKGNASTGEFSTVIAAWLACWHCLPREKIQGMSDPAEQDIRDLAKQLSESQTDSASWLVLLGAEPSSTMKQEILSSFQQMTHRFTR